MLTPAPIMFSKACESEYNVPIYNASEARFSATHEHPLALRVPRYSWPGVATLARLALCARLPR